MITTLDDFLRRRSKIALVQLEEIRDAEGTTGLSGVRQYAQLRYDEYFTPEREAEARRLRAPDEALLTASG
jgi:hypothetical protein